jgi:hypothetical protein
VPALLDVAPTGAPAQEIPAVRAKPRLTGAAPCPGGGRAPAASGVLPAVRGQRCRSAPAWPAHSPTARRPPAPDPRGWQLRGREFVRFRGLPLFDSSARFRERTGSEACA